jgi:hypothetical protein
MNTYRAGTACRNCAELNASVSSRFKDRSRTRDAGSSATPEKWTFVNGGFLIFCGARVTGFLGGLQHKEKESFARGRSELAYSLIAISSKFC